MKKINYSVLMSVYDKEDPLFFDYSLNSIYCQTFKTNNLVLVCDGPVNNEIESVIVKYKALFKNTMDVYRLKKNQGLGNALNFGLSKCANEIILRADTDDYSIPERAQIQIDRFIKDNVDISSSNIFLFKENIEKIVGERNLPKNQSEIISFSKKRCPFNHPSVIYKKSAIIACGGYIELKYKEDYYLWVRMLQQKIKCNNIPDHLVYMRINDNTIVRRINKVEYRSHQKLFNYMLKTKYINIFIYLKNMFTILVKRMIPKRIAIAIYKSYWKKGR